MEKVGRGARVDLGDNIKTIIRRIHALINTLNMAKVGKGARVDLGDKDGNTALALAKR